MENSTSVIVLTLSHRLRSLMTQLTEENTDWVLLPQCAAEWFLQQMVSRKTPQIPEIFNSLFAALQENYSDSLSTVASHLTMQKAEWKYDELWLQFSDRHGKNFPNWENVSLLSIPDKSDREKEGVVILHPKDSDLYYAEVTRMPRHAVVQAEEFLRLGIHSSKKLQRAFEQTPIKRLASRFITLDKPEHCWAFSKTFAYWWKDTCQGYPTRVDNENDDYGPEKKKSSHWKDKTKSQQGKGDVPNYARRVKAGKREYTNPNKCGRGERIETREVYSRIFSKLDKWKDWYFL